MNKKTVLKMGLLMLVGAVVGVLGSLGLVFAKDGLGDVFTSIMDYVLGISHLLYPLILLVMFLPSVYLAQKGKKLLLESETVEEDEIDRLEKQSDKYFEPAVTLNNVFMLTNFLLIGTTFQASGSKDLIVVVFFMLNAVLASVFEILLVKFIQKHDERLKGDPTSFKFHKDFLASLDEAEKLRTYKSGYEAFQFSRIFTFGAIILMMLFNMILDSGALPVVVTCFIGFAQVISYARYSYKNGHVSHQNKL